jgi:cytidylate kinase
MYLDREILRRAAAHLGADQRLIEAREGKSTGLIDNLIRVFSLGAPEAYSVPTASPIYDRDLFDTESRIINDIVASHDAVVLGRGAFCVLKDLPRGIHVFIHAPFQFRAERIMKVKNMARIGEARALVEESDRSRARFIRDMCRTDWADARNYHLCIDAGAAGFPACVETIVRLVNKVRGSIPSRTAS